MDWSDKLSQYLVAEIASRTHSHADYTRFRIACKTWISLLPRFNKNHLPREMPTLMFPCSNYCKFFSPFVAKHGAVYNLEVPSVKNKVCINSSQGWLITAEKSFFVRKANPLEPEEQISFIHLVNPLKPDTTLELPPLERYDQRRDIRKVVLSCSPNQKNCLAMLAFHHHQVACCRLGDERWRSVDWSEVGWNEWMSRTEDIIHHDQKFFMVDNKGSIFVLFDDQIMDNSSPLLPQRVYIPEQIMNKGKLYLAFGSLNELFVVNRRENGMAIGKDRGMSTFDVYKLNLKCLIWSKVESLDNDVMFLGMNDAFTVSFPSLPCSSYNGNCIYFMDPFSIIHPRNDPRQREGGYDVRVFDVKSCNASSIAMPVQRNSGQKRMLLLPPPPPPPHWIMPNAN